MASRVRSSIAPGRRTIQWGRGGEAAEERGATDDTLPILWLQWGRDGEATEEGPPPVCSIIADATGRSKSVPGVTGPSRVDASRCPGRPGPAAPGKARDPPGRDCLPGWVSC
jgi:hypothetical protein